jgi:Zn-dependent peptidase ImmA (M78 family)
MPAIDIKNELPDRLDWPAFLRLQAKWHVSIAALLVRAKSLGVMSEHTYAQGWKALSGRGWRKVEPGSLGNPRNPGTPPTRAGLTETTGVSYSSFNQRSGLPEADVRALLDRDFTERPRVEF